MKKGEAYFQKWMTHQREENRELENTLIDNKTETKTKDDEKLLYWNTGGKLSINFNSKQWTYNINIHNQIEKRLMILQTIILGVISNLK